MVLLPSTNEGDVKLVSTRCIPMGHPVYISYWSDQDVTLKAQQYNFFDDTHGNHAIVTSINLTIHKPDIELINFFKYNDNNICVETDTETKVNIKTVIIINEQGEIPDSTKLLCSKLSETSWESVYTSMVKSALEEKKTIHPMSDMATKAAKWRQQYLQALYQNLLKKQQTQEV